MRIGIDYRPIDQLSNYRRKLRKRSPEEQIKLQTSVSTFGLLAPILIEADGTVRPMWQRRRAGDSGGR